MTTQKFLRTLGERDARAGKSINAFYDAPLAGHHRHNENARAEYEIGYRAAKQEMRREQRAAERRNPEMRHDLGKMTPEETQDLLREVIQLLTEEQLFEVLNNSLSSEQKGELAVAWGNDND